jgi:hypothetical protein
MPNGAQYDLGEKAHRAKQDVSRKDKKEAEDDCQRKSSRASRWNRLYSFLAFVPSRCRYDPDQPFEFSIGLNLLFGIYMLMSFYGRIE